MINTAFQISEETRKMTKSRISHLPKNKNLNLHSSCVYQQFVPFYCWFILHVMGVPVSLSMYYLLKDIHGIVIFDYLFHISFKTSFVYKYITHTHTKKTKRQIAGRYTKVKMTFFNLLGRLHFFPLHISLLSFFVFCLFLAMSHDRHVGF